MKLPDSVPTHGPLQPLAGRNIVLGVSGSVAAYKAADLASKLVQAGATVDVILTKSATNFVGAATFAALTHRPVTTSLFESNSQLAIDHVALATRADCLVVAPATANTIARLALGISDDALVATALATSAPVIVAPAMDADMHEHAATQANLLLLSNRGAHIAGPAEGRMASGLIGKGRMLEPTQLVDHVRFVLGRNGDYAGRHVVVSAGGTQEPLDPVRYLTNRSSGKMGYAIAVAARDRGARVTLVSAPTALSKPECIELINIDTALEMRDAIHEHAGDADLLIMAAAVADFRPAQTANQKLKKGDREHMTIEMDLNPDIIATTHGRKLVKIAFAAETGEAAAKASEKLKAKGAVLVVANDVSQSDSGFGSDTNRVSIVSAGGNVERLPLLDKLAVAHAILDRAKPFLK